MSIQRLEVRHVDAAAATLGEALFDDPLLPVVAPERCRSTGLEARATAE